ncbi:exo-alpha-sialidase [Roseivirga sp. E12]|uniref:sialidase family protein n=1 Tax=Roseivirga sp. E12 TaxID=2819237 RepID=UPI001F45052D|nr:sialidase family protein [Roseivirga sp. E12]
MSCCKAAPDEKYQAVIVRNHGDSEVDTYRIPGLVTSKKGTLIAVYDMRRNGAVDLQEDVDIGMSRSTDKGDSWEPMKVIMDMGEWGGLPENQNGIGDPSVLVDEQTGTIWVAAVWAHGHPGERNWWASKPGMSPKTTSQFMLTKSEDDGLTWSQPINITSQVKEPKWHLLLQGPGKGITMSNGMLVFPAQFKDENEMPHSTIIYSQDRGETWEIGTGAKPNTTESQVVELEDGSLMLNMRDNRGGSRSVYTTQDMGKTWTEHPTSRSALVEPVCMASLIKHNYRGKEYLLFSNPNSVEKRENMTIKLSSDMGSTWPEAHQLLLDKGIGRGYSCMTSINEETIGILYESSFADLVFQKVRISDLLN